MPSVSCDVNAHVGKDRKVEHGLSLSARELSMMSMQACGQLRAEQINIWKGL
ncbi:MAG: hypothetical protein OXC53_06670 [Rhodobacteraceae bacterium]|nr:hypothetical protein [Paracoccaceae bacterium]